MNDFPSFERVCIQVLSNFVTGNANNQLIVYPYLMNTLKNTNDIARMSDYFVFLLNLSNHQRVATNILMDGILVKILQSCPKDLEDQPYYSIVCEWVICLMKWNGVARLVGYDVVLKDNGVLQDVPEDDGMKLEDNGVLQDNVVKLEDEGVLQDKGIKLENQGVLQDQLKIKVKVHGSLNTQSLNQHQVIILKIIGFYLNQYIQEFDGAIPSNHHPVHLLIESLQYFINLVQKIWEYLIVQNQHQLNVLDKELELK